MLVVGGNDDSAERLYEVGFLGDVADQARRVNPTAFVRALPTRTILWTRSSRANELDALLDTLSGLGLTPQEVYESVGPHGSAAASGGATAEYPALGCAGVGREGSGGGSRGSEGNLYCEVRVSGRLGEVLLRHLGWSHRVVQTTVVTLRASHRALGTLLERMSRYASVDYVLAL